MPLSSQPPPAAPVSDIATPYLDAFQNRARAFNHADIGEAYLIATLQGVADARKILVEDAQRMITLLFTILAGAAALVVFGIELGKTDSTDALLVLAIAFSLFLCTPCLCVAARRKVRNAYEFYVAAALHATLVHAGKTLDGGHQWMVRVREIISLLDAAHAAQPRSTPLDFHGDVILRWMRHGGSLEDRSGPNLLQAYAPLLFFTGLFGIIAAGSLALHGLQYDLLRRAFPPFFWLVVLPLALAGACVFARFLRRA